MPRIKSKTCSVCLVTKPGDEFRYADRPRALSYCQACAGKKRCARCREVKPWSEFYVRKAGKDLGGLTAYCKPCASVWTQNYHKQLAARAAVARPTEQTCRRCKTEKPAKDFAESKYTPSGLLRTCRQCRNELARDHRYSLDPGEFEAQIQSQQGDCAMCDEPLQEKFTDQDHDHTCCPGPRSCGKCRRAILCRRCNTAIGLFKDDPDLLLAAAMYVLRWKDRHEAMI